MNRSHLLLWVGIGLMAGVLALSSGSLAQDGAGEGPARREKPKPQAGNEGEKEAQLLEAIANCPTSLVDAIKAAEDASGGKAIAARYQPGKEGAMIIAVQVVVDGKRQNVRIDGATGEVAANPGKEKGEGDKAEKQPKPEKPEKAKRERKPKGGDDEGDGDAPMEE